jgi:large subunit ribosomal protein L4e
MDVKVLTTENAEKKKMKLPVQFDEEVREDLIARVAEAIMNNKRQPYGASIDAGRRHSVEVSKRRREYRGSYGHGISRVPRKVTSRSGTHMNWVGAFAPNTVGGRRAHPPKAFKVWNQKINSQESKKAIRSALAASMHAEIVLRHGHKAPQHYPFILDTQIEAIQKTKDLKKIFDKLGLTAEIARVSERHVRAGKGKMRGRTYKQGVGPLLVVSAICPVMKAAKGLPGVDVLLYNQLNALSLAPGCKAGRLTLFTEGAIENISKNHVYV